MGHDQVGVLDLLVTDQEDVDVERPRTPPLGWDSSRRGLQPAPELEELPWRAFGGQLDDEVEIGPLAGGPTDRFGLVERGDTHDVG
jgi:hypothetical protein